jgi:hypothetical protein
VLEIRAKAKEISVDELKKQLLIPAREKAIKELREKYGFEVASERQDPRQVLLDKYNKIKDKHLTLTKKDKENIDRIDAVSQLFNIPDKSK